LERVWGKRLDYAASLVDNAAGSASNAELMKDDITFNEIEVKARF